MDVKARDLQLDLLRGIAVVGMFFFSFVATLSDSLPAILTHNIPGRLLPGDFVLSLFLFCSGISLAMVQSRHPHLADWRLWRKLSVRLGQMLVASVFITPFSAGAVLGMDEMMLNVVLTVPALFILAAGRPWVWVAAVGIFIINAVVSSCGIISSEPTVYLGGYTLAVFWLPILLGGGLVWSQTVREMKRQLAVWSVLLCFSLIAVGWPDKMRVDASFGVLSVLVGVLSLWLLRSFTPRCRWLEYFGSKPLRMWVLMFCLLGPIRLYAEVELKRRSLPLSPLWACLGSFAWMGCCFVLSRGWDWLDSRKAFARAHR